MKKDLLIKGIVIPLCIGVALGLAFFLYSLSAGDSLAVEGQNAVAYYDNDSKESNSSSSNIVDLTQGQIVATAKFGQNSIDVRYKSSYSDLSDCISLVRGNPFGAVGYGYYYALENNISGFDKDEIIVDAFYGNYRYKYVSSFSVGNETSVFLHSIPKGSGIVIYYEKADSYGFSGEYEALVFREVEYGA